MIELEEIEDVARRWQVTHAEARDLIAELDVRTPVEAAHTVVINVDAYFTAPPTGMINCRCVASFRFTDDNGNVITNELEITP